MEKKDLARKVNLALLVKSNWTKVGDNDHVLHELKSTYKLMPAKSITAPFYRSGYFKLVEFLSSFHIVPLSLIESLGGWRLIIFVFVMYLISKS